jgi:hypothetical protein
LADRPALQWLTLCYYNSPALADISEAGSRILLTLHDMTG